MGAFEQLLSGAAAEGAGVARAARLYLIGQAEAGHICPITMTHACIPTLMLQDELADLCLPRILSRDYDPELKPVAEKDAITLGMGMTEKQGGSDVRANTSTARPVAAAGPGERYLVTGHKWFLSAPMCDAFLVLAQAPGGLSVFFMPRVLADGTLNGLRFQRLKNKLGNKSNASSEVEFANAEAWLIGEEGRGVPNIMKMANLTRVDCALGSAGLMRQALARAVHHTRHRMAFQKALIDQPMMTALLADLALECEAATALSIRLAGACEREAADAADAAYARLMIPVTKYWVTKRGPGMAFEAMECLGGNGYVEDGIMARLYRDLPVNSIWEGTGNVMCLDVLRVFHRDRELAEQCVADLGRHSGQDAVFDRAYRELTDTLAGVGGLAEQNGRWLTERLATLQAAALLMEARPEFVAGTYLATRLDPEGRYGQYGVLPGGTPAKAIIDAGFGN